MNSSTKPDWVRAKAPLGPTYARLKELMKQYSLHTVCEEAHCPNVGDCWGSGTATFMIMGELCTRACRFCNVKSGKPNGFLDPDEPRNVARAVKDLGLKYVVLTSVDRDDLPDGGASHFAKTIRAIKSIDPTILVETLVPDFRGDRNAIRTVLGGGQEVFDHNVETVRRLQSGARDPRANYEQSLFVIRHAKEVRPDVHTKSSIMLGLGETEDEVLQTLRDLRVADVEIVTLGQYLRPSGWHLPVHEYVSPASFDWYPPQAADLGFLYVASGPLVRSSYRAGEFFLESMLRRKEVPP